jgi:hypothetical protein
MASDGWGDPWKLITTGMALVVVTAVVTNRKNGQGYREAYPGCMLSRGHTG